jgi:F-type H+-transporting ATPase subunit gamma
VRVPEFDDVPPLLADMREWQTKGVEIDVVCIGQKATAFFRRLKVNMLASVSHLGEKPQVEHLIGVMKVMLDSFSESPLDRVFLCYNDFINTMTQKPRQDQLLPLPPSDALESGTTGTTSTNPTPRPC